MSAEGKIKVNATTREPETVVSQRYYLADASFLVALQSDPVTVSRLKEAILDPVWPPFLGRRSCPPSMPFYAGTGIYDGLDAALTQGPGVDALAGLLVRLVVEGASGAAVRRRDEVISLRVRRYGYRYVEERLVRLPGGAS